MPLTRIKSLGITDGTITSADFAAGVGGKVLQVVQTVKTDTFASSSSETPIDVTGLSVSITPSSSSNKILVLINISGGGVGGTNTAQFRLLRGSTLIYAGDAAGSRERGYGSFISVDQYTTGTSSGMFLDSPSTTSSTTYKVTVTSNNTVYINRTSHDQDTVLRQRGASTITVMEIAA
jgi:hypothetical protein